MTDISVDLKKFKKNSPDLEVLREAIASRHSAAEMIEADRNVDALERIVSAMRTLRDFSDFENPEFRTLLLALLFDLSEIHFRLKDYKQSEKELDYLFKLLGPLMKSDPERFGPIHIMAMELSTRVLRSRKKTIDMLAKQQALTESLYEKVNAGVASATDKLVESLRRVGQLLAATGDYRAAMKFFAEAIKISKKRTGRVTRKEVAMTIEMAEIMMRVNHMRPRARRLLEAILPHAISLELLDYEKEILALMEIIDADIDREPKWKVFLHKLSHPARLVRRKKEEKAEDKMEEAEKKE